MPNIAVLTSGGVCPGMNAEVMAVWLLCKGIGGQTIGVKNGRVFHMPIDQDLTAQKSFARELHQLLNAQ